MITYDRSQVTYTRLCGHGLWDENENFSDTIIVGWYGYVQGWPPFSGVFAGGGHSGKALYTSVTTDQTFFKHTLLP